MEYTLRHSMPGRVRLTVPALGRSRGLGERLLNWLRVQPGVRSARINYDCASLVVEYDPAYGSALQALFYRFRSSSPSEIKAFCTQTLSDVPPARQEPEIAKDALALPTLSLLLALSANPVAGAINLPLMVYNALPIAKRAWKVWDSEHRLNIDVLDTLAVTSSVLQGNPFTGSLITWLIKLGDWIRDLTAAGSKRAITELLEFQSKTAWLLLDDRTVPVPAAELKAGDRVVVYPGEMIPVDGEIIDGQATIDQKTITGEGLPVSRGKGEAAFAATVIREGQITVRALRVGTATTAGEIVRLVESAPVGDTRMQNHAERFADRLVTPSLALATGTTAVTGDFSRFLSLVIVDYGTGIRVSAPTAVLSSMTHAARAGIIIKSGGHMERLAEIDTVMFDKTGTLTYGSPALIDVIPYQDHITPGHLLGLAAAAETKLKHPVAEALRSKARLLGANVPPCEKTKYKIGLGVEGQVNGYYVHVGNERFMRQSNIRTDPSVLDRASLDEKGFSSLYIAVDGQLAGLVPYSDKIRDESHGVIKTLHGRGIRNTIMLTGDNAVVARAVCGNIGLSQHFADMLPGDKVSVVQELQREGRRVAMVGDGINDSPALSFADVGIAMKHGAEVTHETADVILMEDSLWKLVKAIEISQGAVGLVRQNYAIVASLNTLALLLALPGGLVTPEVTALISNGSAILASANGVRPILRNQ